MHGVRVGVTLVPVRGLASIVILGWLGCGSGSPPASRESTSPGSATPTVPVETTSVGVPADCSRHAGSHAWPVRAGPRGGDHRTPPPSLTPAVARASVDAVRAAIRDLPLAIDLQRAYRACMLASDEHFVIYPIDPAEARARVTQHVSPVGLWLGRFDDLRDDVMYEVYWGGSSDRFIPAGPISGFVRKDGTVALVLQWPEG